MSYSNGNSFEQILDRCLSNERLVDVDKRPGSIIYDTLAPLCMELADVYIKMDIMEDQSYLLTAVGSNLDKKAYDYGIVRQEATQAKVIGEFKKYMIDPQTGNYVIDPVTGERVLEDMDVPVGTRFSLSTNSNIIYQYQGLETIVVDDEEIEVKVLLCESAGTGGNVSNVAIFALTPVINLVTARITSVLYYGENEETDEELRTRTQESISNVAFGGNVQDYVNKVKSLENIGVGGVKVFPAYMDDKHVVLSLSSYSGGQFTSTMVEAVEDAIEAVTIGGNRVVGTIKQLKFDGNVVISAITPNNESSVELSYRAMSNEAVSGIKQVLDPTSNEGNGYGIAPIGHTVTVKTPTESDVDISMTIELRANYQLSDVYENIKDNIQVYMKDLRSLFGTRVSEDWTEIDVYISDVISVVQNTEGVKSVDVSSVRLNGSPNNIEYIDTPEEQNIPILGILTINGYSGS